MVNDKLEIIHQASVIFDSDLPEFRTQGGAVIDKSTPRCITAPTIMFVKALDMVMDRLTVAGVDFSKIAAVSGSAQVFDLEMIVLIDLSSWNRFVPLKFCG